MGRKLNWSLELLESGAIELGRAPTSSAITSDVCMKMAQMMRAAIHAERIAAEKARKPIATMRLKRLPPNPDLQRIASLERLIAQYEPVAVQQSALGFGKIREKVTAWQAELATLTTHKEQA